MPSEHRLFVTRQAWVCRYSDVDSDILMNSVSQRRLKIPPGLSNGNRFPPIDFSKHMNRERGSQAGTLYKRKIRKIETGRNIVDVDVEVVLLTAPSPPLSRFITFMITYRSQLSEESFRKHNELSLSKHRYSK